MQQGSILEADVSTATPAMPDAPFGSRPRVLFVSPVSDIKGGAERVLLELLAHPGIEPVIAVPEAGELSDFARQRQIPVAFYHPTGLMGVRRPPRLGQIAAALIDAVRCAVRLRRIARQYRCDIIHTNGLKAHALGVLLRPLFGMRVLIHLHDIPYSGLEKLIWRLIGTAATRVIIVSPPCWPGALGNKITVLKNAIRPIRPALDPPSRVQQVRLGYVGRYHPHKCLDLLLDWVSAARAAGIDAHAIMRGRPDSDYMEYWDRIKARIAAEGLAPFVVDQGWCHSSTVYDDIDFLLLPSQIPDPAPLVIPEAMSAGVVVIAYPAGGVPLLIPSGTGILAREPANFAAALQACLDDPDSYERMRVAAYAHVRSAHDPGALGRQFVAICQSVLAGANGAMATATARP